MPGLPRMLSPLLGYAKVFRILGRAVAAREWPGKAPRR